MALGWPNPHSDVRSFSSSPWGTTWTYSNNSSTPARAPLTTAASCEARGKSADYSTCLIRAQIHEWSERVRPQHRNTWAVEGLSHCCTFTGHGPSNGGSNGVLCGGGSAFNGAHQLYSYSYTVIWR